MAAQDDPNLPEAKPYFYFQQYADGVESQIENIDYSVFEPYEGQSLESIRKTIITEFDNTPFDALIKPDKSNQYLDDFFSNYVNKIFPPEILKKLLVIYPISIPTQGNNVIRNMILYLVSIIHDSQDSFKVLHYIIMHFSDQGWHGNASATNETVTNGCLCQLKKNCPVVPKNKMNDKITPLDYTDYMWVVANKSCVSTYRIKDGQIVNPQPEPESLSSFQSKKDCVQIISPDQTKTVYPIDQNQIPLLTSHVTFPELFVSIPKYVPCDIKKAFYEALMADDLLFLRTMAHYSVIRIDKGGPFCEALLNIYSYGGKVHPLFMTLAGMEFENPKLLPSGVLRANSHLTNMIKVVNKRFGFNYYQSVIKPLSKYVERKGNIGLKTPAQMSPENMKEARVMLFTVLKNILASADKVPNEIRHLISILKSMASIKFNENIATYNSISGYFFLRFVASVMTDPTLVDNDFRTDSTIQSDIRVPFLQLIQTLLNLNKLQNRMECFSSWNERIERHIFPKLTRFAYSLSEFKGQPNYPPPSSQELDKSLDTILNLLSGRHKEFMKRYNALKEIKLERYPPVGWCFGYFLTQFFKNIAEIEETA